MTTGSFVSSLPIFSQIICLQTLSLHGNIWDRDIKNKISMGKIADKFT
jgi:hypothetical protein